MALGIKGINVYKTLIILENITKAYLKYKIQDLKNIYN